MLKKDISFIVLMKSNSISTMIFLALLRDLCWEFSLSFFVPKRSSKLFYATSFLELHKIILGIIRNRVEVICAITIIKHELNFLLCLKVTKFNEGYLLIL